MEYSRIEEINKRLKPVTLEHKNKKGEVIKNDYNTVNQRILAFRELYPNGSIQTEIISHADGVCVIKATASDDEGKVIATGHAIEEKTASYLNQVSYIENCETSAIGRCLGIIGIGSTTSIASVEEMEQQMIAEEKRKADTVAGMKEELIDLWVKAGGEKDDSFDTWFKKYTENGFTGEEFGLMKAILLKKIIDTAEKKGAKK